MALIDSVQTCFVKYADFQGRASRAEFWHWALFNLVVSIGLSVVSEWLSIAFTLATLLPYIAVTTRRLHDTDRGGWSQLVGLIPVIGWVLMLVWLAQPAPPDVNRFG
jgi:uncharacterized membrane protein YhaH (DUF805 family)